MTDPKPQSPMFVKTYDFLVWLIPTTIKFPKSQRFLLAERLSKVALDFYDTILEAVQLGPQNRSKLQAADRLLTKIRLYIRLSYDLKCISDRQYAYAARQTDELGRLLGGWLKKEAEESTLSGRQATIF